jgi:tetratricopeptide (TPR) repeat protein
MNAPAVPSTPAPLPPAPASIAAAARPTIAVAPPLSPAQQQTAAAVDAMFGTSAAPVWAAKTIAASAVDPASLAASQEPTLRPMAIDPAMAALYAGQGRESGAIGTPSAMHTPMRTGMRKERTPLTIALWIAIGIVVIGGGVFAGFQIRAMRLQKQIAAARDRATDLTKADTWAGWSSARDSLAQIVGASSTLANKSALARARGVLAFEFDDGAADARSAVDDLGGQGGLDSDLAAAYVALAESDAKAAKLASDAALSGANQDPAALYVAGRAALLSGDPKAAITYLKEAYQHDARPLYGVGLARALADSNAWDEAIGTLDRVLAASQDHPAAVIERARLMVASGRVVPGAAASMELRSQIEKIVAEGAKAPADQPRGVSPAQVAFANLVLARIDHARGDITTARGDMHAAANVGLDDQRFGEEAIDTLFAIGELAPAKASAERAIVAWPQSRRARVTLAQVLLATGKPNDALGVLDKAETTSLPMGLAVRGQAKLASGDDNGARADFEAALKKLPDLEPALVGRAWIELGAGNVDDARKIVEPHVSPNGSVTPAMATIYAAVLRASGDPAARDKAKAMLEKVVAGPPGLEVSRAQLELARLDRDLGDFSGAKIAYSEAAKSGNFDARLESALVMIEDRDAAGGHDTLESLLREQGDHVSGNLAIEVARARMLVGDNSGAQQLLDATAKTGTVIKWKLERERGRLALRKGDFAGAVTSLSQALETSGNDAETFLLAADAATSDDKKAPELAVKVKRLVPERLKGMPEASIVTGKLLIADKKFGDAVTAFQSAIDALTKARSALRRQAQAHFGLAVAQYNNGEDAQARNQLQLVMEQDPTLYTAYLYSAYLVQDKQRKAAFDYAKRAIELDPDSVDGWLLAGQLANKLGDHKFFADAVARITTIAPDRVAELRR